MVEQLQDSTVVIDGREYDAETGGLLRTLGKDKEWVPETPSDFERIGEWLSALDGELAGIEARRKFLNENLDTMAREVQRRKDGLLWKFRPLIEDHAKANLPKGKRTWTCPFMSVAFRAVKARLKVTDKDLALSWAKENAPEAVVIKEEFQVSKLPAAAENALMLDPVAGFDVAPEGESVTIKTSSSGQ